MVIRKKKLAKRKSPPETPNREPTECFDQFLLADDDDWLPFIEPAFCNNPTAADALAHLLGTIRSAIESGPEGTRRALFTLSDGIRIAYKYTAEHKAALRLYNLSLTGELHPGDDPLTLISGALKRAGLRAISDESTAEEIEP